MSVHLIIIILALIGVLEALYLNYERRRHRAPVCVIGNECGIVWESPYSRTFGVSNEVLGIIYYATLLVVEGATFYGDTSFQMKIGEYLILGGGAIMSVYYLFVQWRIIKAWCFWCTLSAIIVWLIVLARVIL